VFLEKPDGGIERVDAARFVRAIGCLHRSLRPVVLMSCNTATRSPTDPRVGFAPALLSAAFTRAFYEERRRHRSLHAKDLPRSAMVEGIRPSRTRAAPHGRRDKHCQTADPRMRASSAGSLSSH
jgi:hypothetical protein